MSLLLDCFADQRIRRNIKELKANHRKYFAICNPLFNQLLKAKDLVERYKVYLA